MVKIDFVNAQEPAINDTNLNQMQLNIENAINAQVSGDTLPVGCIVPFTSDTVPENWLLCDGQAVSRTDYALLFSIIGTTYGVGDGSTTFNVPDLRTRVPLGKGTATGEGGESYNFQLGNKGGEYSHKLTINEMPQHSHEYDITRNDGAEGWARCGNWAAYGKHNTGKSGGDQTHNNLQPFTVTNFIIKAKQSSGLVATVVDNLNSTSTTDALSANQGKVLNEKFTRKIATRTLSDEIYVTDERRIFFNQIRTNTDKLLADTGAIQIGQGVSRVMVSANVFANPDNEYMNGYTWTYIRKNDKPVSIAIAPNIAHFTSTVHSPILIDVQQGDIIDLYKHDDSHSKIRAGGNTYLTVEVVE